MKKELTIEDLKSLEKEGVALQPLNFSWGTLLYYCNGDIIYNSDIDFLPIFRLIDEESDAFIRFTLGDKFEYTKGGLFKSGKYSIYDDSVFLFEKKLCIKLKTIIDFILYKKNNEDRDRDTKLQDYKNKVFRILDIKE